MKKLLLISMLIGAMPLAMMAQDDDLYFVAKKKKATTTEQVTDRYGMPKDTYYAGSDRSGLDSWSALRIIDWLITRLSGVVIVRADMTPGGTHPGTTIAIGTTLGMTLGTTEDGIASTGMIPGTTVLTVIATGTIPGITDMVGVTAMATLTMEAAMYRPTATPVPSVARTRTDM